MEAIDIDDEDITRAIFKIKAKKAPGPDKIKPDIIRLSVNNQNFI